ncbi:Mavicyanin protein [Spatholobus suberectus]|nr:Mavicyanin protein [Spatholobus suberectus]
MVATRSLQKMDRAISALSVMRMVSQQEYEHCTSLEPLRIFNSSPVILPLKERGVLFFICSISNYCCLGQKVVISVHERSLENPPSPSPSPSPSQVPVTTLHNYHQMGLLLNLMDLVA